MRIINNNNSHVTSPTPRINYFDEREQETSSVLEEDTNKYIPTSIAHKVILWSGISIRVSETSPTPLFSYFNGIIKGGGGGGGGEGVSLLIEGGTSPLLLLTK